MISREKGFTFSYLASNNNIL